MARSSALIEAARRDELRAAYVTRLVDAAPPLSDDVVDTLAAIVAPVLRAIADEPRRRQR